MKLILLLTFSLLASLSMASQYYVATNGNDSNDGLSLETPFASIVKAIDVVNPGDIIWLRGGVYKHNSTIYIRDSGTENDTLFLLAYENEKPVLDFSGTAMGKRGMILSGSYWKIKGIEMMYAGDNALNISGNHNVIEFCSFHDNKDTGLQLGNGAHDNKMINCDSYFNADPTDFGDADGFAAKLDVGSNNYFYGCRAWNNVDDGWDGYMRGNDDVSTVLENCWTWSNGYFKDGRDGGAKANGNGFKVGGSDDRNLKHNFTLINCLAFYNKSKGFDQNNNRGNMFFYNCTGYGNLGYDYSIPGNIAPGKVAEVKNCVLFNGNKNLASFVVQERNSWNAPFSVDASDFISVDTTGISGPRQSDGSLPVVDFMRLNDDSDLVNAGTDLGFPFQGPAPDLGAFETSVGVGFNSVSSASFKAYQSSASTLTLEFERQLNGKIEIGIYNLNGKLVYSAEENLNGLASRQVLSNCTLAQGIYLVRLHGKQINSAGKLIIR